MPRLSRATAVVVTLAAGTIACSGLLEQKEPASDPGTQVTGFYGDCICLVWSADSKTLYGVASLLSPPGGALMAVDPTTGVGQKKWNIDPAAGGLLISPDGSTLFFTIPIDTARTQYSVYRMALASGTVTSVTTARRSEVLVSPDGAALAYHAVGGSTSADTIALIDIASGGRRASTVVSSASLGAFSGDGTRLILNSDPFQIWHVITGGRDTLAANTWSHYVRSIRWSGGDFRALYNTALTATGTLRDSSLSGGAAVTYAGAVISGATEWQPQRSAVFVEVRSTFCTSGGCNGTRFEFHLVTPGGVTLLGSINSPSFTQMVASPDGHWLAHVEAGGPIYLLNPPVP